LRNDHTSPFEQVNFTFHLKMPIFVARQWIRHRTASVNEISGRYSVMQDEFYVPDGEHIAAQSEDNKQGRSDEPVEPELQTRVQTLFRDEQHRVYETYTELIDSGVARELARIDLPLSLYTEFYWQMDLHNLFHFLRLRMDSHAQYEIRVYAETLYGIIAKVCPIACEAFEEYVVGAIRFSRSEVEAIKRLIRGEDSGLTGRDLERFTNKLERGRE
jgi:thymidylate synthase (FAD)